VFTPHGARVVRSVAAIPGWTATWDPQDGPSVTLAVAVDGLVQAVDVPPGLGTLVFSYNPPGYLAGCAMVSMTAVMARISTSSSPGATSTP